jgi:hypothetical protein
MDINQFNTNTKLNKIDFSNNEKIIIREASKSNCIIYGGFIRDKLLNRKYNDIDMLCDNYDFIHFLTKYNDVKLLHNENNKEYYLHKSHYAEFNNILLNYGLKDSYKNNEYAEYSCNAIAYSTTQNTIFATNNKKLEDVLKDISEKKCTPVIDFIMEYRKNLMISKGFFFY